MNHIADTHEPKALNPHGLSDPLNRWIGIAGPTASGKSSISLLVAHHEAVEIVSVDSALVYTGMDIGTAKPTPRQRSQVPHHLIDILLPQESYSAARFAQDARRLIREINQRGRLPLLVGGTMLYFKALMEGLDAIPASDPITREQLNEEGRRRGWPALHAELMTVDALTAQRLKPHDAQRIQRALEVWRMSGRPLSSFQRRLHGPHETDRDASDEGSVQGLPAQLFISLEPQDRAWLHARIAERFDYMLQGDFLDEVRGLMAQPGLHPDLPSMRCVGYRQAWEALAQGMQGAELVNDVRERGIAATRQLAKRQLTWLRSLPQRVQVDAQSATAADEVLNLVKQHGH